MGKLTIQRYEVRAHISDTSSLSKRFLDLTDAMEYYYYVCDNYLRTIKDVHVYDLREEEKVLLHD